MYYIRFLFYVTVQRSRCSIQMVKKHSYALFFIDPSNTCDALCKNETHVVLELQYSSQSLVQVVLKHCCSHSRICIKKNSLCVSLNSNPAGFSIQSWLL